MSRSFLFEALILKGFVPSNSASSGFVSLSVFGHCCFGANGASGSVRVALTGCATSTWLSDSGIVCRLSSGTFNHVPILVTFGLQQGSRMQAWCYDSATVMSAGAMTNVPTSGSTFLDIAGLSFGNAGYSGCVRVGLETVPSADMMGGTACKSSIWRSDSGVICKLGGGFGSAALLVTFGLQQGILSHLWNYNMINIHFVSPRFLSSSGSQLISVSGQSCSSSSFQSRIGSSGSVRSAWSSDTLIFLKSSSGMQLTNTIGISLNYQMASMSNSFTFGAPTIYKHSMLQKPLATGFSIFNIIGMSFGNSGFSPHAKMASTMSGSTAWTSASSLNTKSSIGMTSQQLHSKISEGIVLVSVLSFASKLSDSWTYVESAVSAVSESYPPSTGMLTSALFSRFMGPFDTCISSRVGSSYSVYSAWKSDSIMFLKIPTGFGFKISLLLTAGFIVKKPNVFSFQIITVRSLLKSLNSTEATTAAQSIFINTLNLGQQDGSPKLKFDYSGAESSVWSADSSITCRLPHGLRFQSRIISTISAVRSFSDKMLSNIMNWTEPHTFRRPNSPLTGTMHLIIESRNFGIFEASLRCKIGISSALITKWCSDSTIILRCSSGDGNMLTIKVSAISQGYLFSNTYFSYLKANISALSNISITSGALVALVRGNSFGMWSSCIKMKIGETNTMRVHWLSDSHISCKIPAFSEALISHVILSCGTLSVNHFAIRAHKGISHLTNGAYPLTGSTVAFILGTYSPFSRSPTASVGISNADSSDWRSDSAVSIKSSAGCGNILDIKMSLLNHNVITAKVSARFRIPMVSDLSPSNAPTTGHTYITLYGRNLGMYEASACVLFNNNPNLASKWVSDSVILSLSPKGFASPSTIVISVNRLYGKFETIFSYDFFSFSHLKVASDDNVSITLFAVTGSSVLTLRGLDFGGMDPSAKISNGHTNCEFSHWISDTILVGKSAKAASGGGPASFIISVDSGWSAFSYLRSEVFATLALKSIIGSIVPNTGHSFMINCVGIRASDQSLKIRMLSTAQEMSKWTSDSSIKVKVSSSSCDKLLSAIAITTFSLVSHKAYSFLAQCDNSFKPGPLESLVTTGAAFFTISGSSFTNLPQTSKTRIGLSSSLTTQWSSDSSLISKISMIAGLVQSLIVSTDSTSLNGAGNLSAASQIYSVFPPSIPITGYVRVVFNGRSFGPFENSVTLYATNRVFRQCRWTSDSSISGIAPPGMYQAVLKLEITEHVSVIKNFLFPYLALPIVTPLGEFVGFPLLEHQAFSGDDVLNMSETRNLSYSRKHTILLQDRDERLGQLHATIFLLMNLHGLENSTLISVSSSDGSDFGLKLSTSGLFLFGRNFSDTAAFQIDRDSSHLIVLIFDGESLQFCIDGTTVARSSSSSFQNYFDLRNICIICDAARPSDYQLEIMLLFAMPISERDMDSIAVWITSQSQNYHNRWDATTASRILSIMPSEFPYEGNNMVTISASRLSANSSNVQFYVATCRCSISHIDLSDNIFTCALPKFYGYATVELIVDGIRTSLRDAIKTNDPFINQIQQSPIVGGKMSLTIFGLNFGSSVDAKDLVSLTFGAMGALPKKYLHVISHTNRVIELVVQLNLTRHILDSNAASLEIGLLHSNFAPMMIPIKGVSCHSHDLTRDCMDCCLRNCMHASASTMSIQSCEIVCSEECPVLKNDCITPEDVIVSQSNHGDCVNISWHHRHEKETKCTYEVRFSVSEKLYQLSTNELYAMSCGMLQNDLLRDIRIVTFNHMLQPVSWSNSQSFRVLFVTPPSKVLDLVITEFHHGINVSWMPPIHHGASLIVEYNVIVGSINIVAKCCSVIFEKLASVQCVDVTAKSSAGQGEVERVCMPTFTQTRYHLKIQHVENFSIFPGHAVTKTISLEYDNIREVRVIVDKRPNDVSFVYSLSPFSMDLTVTLSESSCGTYSAMIYLETSYGEQRNISFDIAAINSWAGLVPRDFASSAKVTITIFGCFAGISQSNLIIKCREWNFFINSSNEFDSYHEFNIVLWNHTSCISSISLSHELGSVSAIIPFNNQMHSDRMKPSVTIRADIIKIEPTIVSSASMKYLTVSGSGFSNVQADWGVYDSSNPAERGNLAFLKSILFRTLCIAVSTHQLLCEIPDWTMHHSAGLSALIFYDLDTDAAISSDLNARVEFLPLMTGFTPNFAYAVGGSFVTLHGSGFVSDKIHILQNVDIQDKNLVFTQTSATQSSLTFKVPRWSFGPITKTQLELKDITGNVILKQKIDFTFKSIILRSFPTSMSCTASDASLITFSGIGFSAEPTYISMFTPAKQQPSKGNHMNSTCIFKNSKTILCISVDWCLLNGATMLSIGIIIVSGSVESLIYSNVPLHIQYAPEIVQIRPQSLSQSGSGVLFMIGKGFPMNASSSMCIFVLEETILNSSLTFFNSTALACDIPSWGTCCAAQMAQAYFQSNDLTAPVPDPIEIEFVSTVSSLQPSIQSLFGGTLLYLGGLGFNRDAPEFKCVFSQGNIRLITTFSAHSPSSGSCPTPFWTAANSANRTYEVKLVYGHDTKEMNAGFIELA